MLVIRRLRRRVRHRAELVKRDSEDPCSRSRRSVCTGRVHGPCKSELKLYSFVSIDRVHGAVGFQRDTCSCAVPLDVYIEAMKIKLRIFGK